MRYSLVLRTVGLAIVLFSSISLAAQQQKQVEGQSAATDVGKRRVERPTEKLIADSAESPRLDISKSALEFPLELMVEQGAKQSRDRGKFLIELPIERALKDLALERLNDTPKEKAHDNSTHKNVQIKITAAPY